MLWKQMVARGFGIADCIFAVHPSDKQDAKAAIAAAKGVRLENGKYPTLSALFILGSIY